jgi:hypothetical protein
LIVATAIFPTPFVVLGVGEELFDVNPLALVHHANDEAVVVASDIEDRQIAHHIRCRKRLANVLKVLPFSLNGRIEPHLQGRFGVSVSRSSLEEAALADDVHNSS